MNSATDKRIGRSALNGDSFDRHLRKSARRRANRASRRAARREATVAPAFHVLIEEVGDWDHDFDGNLVQLPSLFSVRTEDHRSALCDSLSQALAEAHLFGASSITIIRG